jgi:hypothetical protein
MIDYTYKIEIVKHLTNNGYNLLMEFHEWIYKKFVVWRGEASGREGSRAEFARWLDISDKSLYQYFLSAGQVPKSKKIIDKLVKKYGQEVYDVLNIIPPPDFIQKLETIYYKLEDNEPRQRQFMRRLSDLLAEYIPDDQ